jgi:hypothetical protein
MLNKSVPKIVVLGLLISLCSCGNGSSKTEDRKDTTNSSSMAAPMNDTTMKSSDTSTHDSDTGGGRDTRGVQPIRP